MQTLRASGMFDADWYISQYADVTASGVDPLRHFLHYGMAMGRDPGPDVCDIFLRLASGHCADDPGAALRHLLRQGMPDLVSNRVMLAVAVLARRGRRQDAIRLVRHHLGPDAERPISLLLANISILEGSERLWLEHVNTYLEPYEIARIRLRPGPSILHRLCTEAAPRIGGGPLVSVIMPAFQAAAHIEPAARSILQQSWANLELLIVDDGSDDGTWQQMQQLAASDSRVRIHRNFRNLGPYVSKNLALQEARGDFVTGHDADDWAHPQRIERHLAEIMASEGAIKAGTGMMLRVSPGGLFEDVIGTSAHHSPDGFRRRAFISCMFERRFLLDKIGFYDPVKFGADGEMMHRTRIILDGAFRDLDLFTMVCLDLHSGLTNHPEFGLKTNGGVSAVRRDYNASWVEWHRNTPPEGLFNPYPFGPRMFDAPKEIIVDLDGTGQA